MMDYVLRVKIYVDCLTVVISKIVSKEDHNLYLLGGLSSEYNSFVVSVTSLLKMSSSRLLAYEHRLQQQQTAH